MNRAALVAVALVAAGPLGAQYREARGPDYLFAASAIDTRALWVNPAGLGADYEASIMLEVVGDRSRTGDLAPNQIAAGFNSRGIALGYRRDTYNDTLTGHTWRLGLGTVFNRLAVGGSLTLHSNGDGPGQRGLALGVQYPLGRAVALGAVLSRIGRPTVHDAVLDPAATGGVSLIPAGGVRLDAQGTLVFADGATARSFQTGLTLATDGMRIPVGLTAVLALDRNLAPARLTIGFILGGRDRGIAAVSAARPGGGLLVDAVSLTGVASRVPN